MNLKIEKEILLENINNVSKALSNRNIIPILNGIMFELNSEGLSLTATDNDITIKSFIDKSNIKEIIKEGTVIVYGRFLVDILRKLPNEILTLEEMDGSKLIISTKNSKYNLNCFNSNDYPDIKLEEVEKPLKIMSETFKEIINQTAFATSTQEIRPILRGVNIKIIGTLLECVATDSYRLAKKQVDIGTDIDSNVNVVVPAKNIVEFIKIIENENQELRISIFKNVILFKYKNILFQSSLLNGTYPNTDSLFPTEFENVVEVDNVEFFNIIDRASLLAQSRDKNIIKMNIQGNNILITSSSAEIGKIEELIQINKICGEDMTISFNARYMIEALKTIKTDKIKIMLNGEIKPIILKEEDNESLIQLILPIKTY